MEAKRVLCIMALCVFFLVVLVWAVAMTVIAARALGKQRWVLYCVFISNVYLRLTIYYNTIHRGSWMRSHILSNNIKWVGQHDIIRGSAEHYIILNDEFNSIRYYMGTNLRLYLLHGCTLENSNAIPSENNSFDSRNGLDPAMTWRHGIVGRTVGFRTARATISH
jgi:hypothetical protein